MKNKAKQGFSLLETMMASIVLGTLAIGGSAALRHAGGTIMAQQSQRAALAAASSVMEQYIHHYGLDALKSKAESAGGKLSLPSATRTFDDGRTFLVSGEVTYDTDDKVKLWIQVDGHTIEPVVLCYEGLLSD